MSRFDQITVGINMIQNGKSGEGRVCLADRIV